jgi:hypothetical protein
LNSSYILGFLLIAAVTGLAVFGMLGVRKKVSLSTLSQYHQVAGYMLAVVGTMYSVLLGFVIVDSMHHMQDVRETVSLEASSLANIFLCAEGLPVEKKKVIRDLCHQYAYDVIHDEWKSLRYRKYSQKTFHEAFRLWKEITHFEPKTAREQQLQEQLIQQVCSMTQNHRVRVVSASHGVAPIMWIVLCIGGIFTVGFTYFFGVENLKVQVLMTSMLTMTLSLNLYLVYVFGNPMAREFGVLPGSFTLDLIIFDNFENETMPPAQPIPSNW